MLQKLRRKIVAVCMALVTLVLAVVLLTLYASVRQNMEALSRQVLEQVIREDRGLPRPGVSVTIGGDQILLPYFTVNLWGSTAYVTGGTYADLENTEALETILRRCLEQAADSGVVEGYHLRYLRQDNGLYQKLAFVDTSMEQAVARRMMGSYALAAVLALVLLLGASVLLARWVTRPTEQAWQQQKQFLSDASHELKTPLTVILSNAALLEEAQLEPRAAGWAEQIHAEGRRMRALVEQMLTLARADQAAASAPMEPLSLSELVTDCALSFEPVAFEAGKRLEEEIAPDLTVTGDGARLRQLVSILLDNAVKYGAADVPIQLTLEAADRQARLTVSNGGEPIPPEQLPHLFERFYRADASRGEQSGFGLGLSIAAAIAREHRASLRAESDSRSTRFLFTIPLKK